MAKPQILGHDVGYYIFYSIQLHIVIRFCLMDLTHFIINPLWFNHGKLTLNLTLITSQLYLYGLHCLGYLLDTSQKSHYVRLQLELTSLYTEITLLSV